MYKTNAPDCLAFEFSRDAPLVRRQCYRISKNAKKRKEKKENGEIRDRKKSSFIWNIRFNGERGGEGKREKEET